MALIKCPECNNDISDQAEKCPKCGYELKKTEEPPKDTKKFKGKIDYKYIILGLLVVVVGFYMLNQRKPAQAVLTAARLPHLQALSRQAAAVPPQQRRAPIRAMLFITIPI